MYAIIWHYYAFNSFIDPAAAHLLYLRDKQEMLPLRLKWVQENKRGINDTTKHLCLRSNP